MVQFFGEFEREIYTLRKESISSGFIKLLRWKIMISKWFSDL